MGFSISRQLMKVRNCVFTKETEIMEAQMPRDHTEWKAGSIWILLAGSQYSQIIPNMCSWEAHHFQEGLPALQLTS